MYDEYGEVIMEDDGYYYSPHAPEVLSSLIVIMLRMLTITLIGCVSNVLLKQQYHPCDIPSMWLYLRKNC